MGGDFFNIIKTPSCNIVTIMVDCTGHGLEASMYATLLKSVCDRHISLLDNPNYLANFTQLVNIDVAQYITSDQYPVMFVSVFNPKEMKYYYSSANGEHPYLIRDSKVYKLKKAIGMHLGYNTESQYTAKSFQVNPDDIIFCYSDAIIEIEGAPWDRADDSKFKDELSKMGNGLAEDNKRIMQLVHNTAGNTILDDDLSLIYMQVKNSCEFSKSISSLDEVDDIRNRLAKNLTLYDYSRDEVDKISIVLTELVINAISHGNKHDNSKKVHIEYSMTCKTITLTVEDEGSGFDESLIPDPTSANRLETLLENDDEEEYSHGRGVWMVRKFMDNVVFSKGGKLAVVTKDKEPAYTINSYNIEKDGK